MSEITHFGEIIKVDGNRYWVRIEQTSACATCHAKGACTASDTKEKVVEAYSLSACYEVGEHVRLVGQHAFGLKAVFYAYVLPLLLMFVLLVALIYAGISEDLAGIIALLSVVLYAGILYFFKEKLKKKFTFELTKIE